MTQFLVLVAICLGALALLGLALSIGLIWKGRPVSHCGGASREFDGDCPVCGSATGCEGGGSKAAPSAERNGIARAEAVE